MKVAYLVNQYPHPSHTFIRREIAALEALGAGIEVLRFTVRRSTAPLLDPADREEAARTVCLLEAGAPRLLLDAAATLVRRPVRFLRALGLALRLGWRAGGSAGAVGRHVAYLVEACALARAVEAPGVAHVHAHFGTNPAAVAMLCRALGGPPYSFTVHGPEEFDRPEALSLREKVTRAAFTVAVCDYGRAQLLRWARPEDRRKLEVVRCSPGPECAGASRSPVPAAPRLVCVGRLGEQKGHHVLLDALSRLKEEGLDFEVRLLGDGPLRAPLEAMARERGLDGRVRFDGWADGAAVRAAILSARALVAPSLAEGLPVVLLEALALGRAAVATWVAGVPELIAPGRCGWLVPPGSVEALADALREVLAAAPADLERMGAAGAAVVALRHDASREAARLAALFARGDGDGGGDGVEAARAVPKAPP